MRCIDVVVAPGGGVEDAGCDWGYWCGGVGGGDGGGIPCSWDQSVPFPHLHGRGCSACRLGASRCDSLWRPLLFGYGGGVL